MKWYSEKLDRMFNSEKECVEAESAHEKAVAEAEAKKKAFDSERAARAKEIDVLREQASEASKKYVEGLRAFIKDYGSYHNTVKGPSALWDLFSWL